MCFTLSVTLADLVHTRKEKIYLMLMGFKPTTTWTLIINAVQTEPGGLARAGHQRIVSAV